MTTPRAYQHVTLAHGACTLRLRPSLRAAFDLERLHDGFPGLFQKVQEGGTTTLRAVIRSGADDHHAAERFLRHTRNMPLAAFLALTQAPALDLVAAIFPEPEGEAPASQPARKITWPEIFDDLFKIATGWLEWAPETAWTATPHEITSAYAAYLDKLKALHGTADDADQPTERRMTEEQRQRNIDAGLDPDFDRAGLHALRDKLQGAL